MHIVLYLKIVNGSWRRFLYQKAQSDCYLHVDCYKGVPAKLSGAAVLLLLDCLPPSCWKWLCLRPAWEHAKWRPYKLAAGVVMCIVLRSSFVQARAYIRGNCGPEALANSHSHSIWLAGAIKLEAWSLHSYLLTIVKSDLLPRGRRLWCSLSCKIRLFNAFMTMRIPQAMACA